jgi:hypothetical protein
MGGDIPDPGRQDLRVVTDLDEGDRPRRPSGRGYELSESRGKGRRWR